MILALSNPYPAMILLALGVAAYMFAALFWSPLRFIFRMKRFAATVVGMDEDDNQRLADGLALVLCPLIGVGAVIAAGVFVVQWKNDVSSRREMKQMLAERQEQCAEAAGEVLGEWELKEIYFDNYPKEGLTEEGRAKVEEFAEQVADDFEQEWVPLDPQADTPRRGNLTLEFEPGEEGEQTAKMTMVADGGVVHVLVSGRGAKAIPAKFVFHLPDDLKGQLADLEDLERVDLEALKREADRKRAEEERRLMRYREKVYSGTPVWQIHDSVQALPESEKAAKRAEFVGMEFDWEVRLASVREVDGKLAVTASQSRQGPGPSWSVFFEIERSMLPESERKPPFRFARIRGEILDFEKGVRVEVRELEEFKP